ncbi:MAG: ABC transporter substrate-binding protein [Micromonosporaceae bacterium]
MRSWNRIRVTVGTLSVLALGIVAAGCGDPAGSGSGGDAEEGPIKVGLVTPLSGGAADYGTAFANGVKLAAKEINEAGGVDVGGTKRELEIITCDDEFLSDKAVACGRRLSSQDGVKVIMTPSSLAAFPMMGFNEQAGFLLMATSQTPEFTEQGNKLVVRFINNTDNTMDLFVDLLLKYGEANDLGKRAAVMEVNTELGQSWVANFTAAWEQKGGEITGKASYDANDTDFFSQISTLLEDDPEVMVLTTVCNPSATVIQQARELGYEGAFINSAACSGEELISILGDEAEGVVFESSNWAFGEPPVAAFQEAYQEEFGIVPQFISGVGYEGLRWLAEAIEVAGTADDVMALRQAMGEGLERLEPNMFDMSNLTETGDVTFPMYVGYIEGGTVRGFKG